MQIEEIAANNLPLAIESSETVLERPVTALSVGATCIVVGFGDGRVEQRDLSGEQMRSWQAHDDAITLLTTEEDGEEIERDEGD